jgi:major membrane immunogen (membrane-anchored lipoprotein)
MKALMKKSRLIGIAAGIAATVVVLGCGSDDSGLQSRYKVSGTVTYKGQPVPKGSIVFEPTNPPMPQGRVANGTIENGSYSLTTSNKNEGDLPGEYKVIILSSDLDVAELAKKQGQGGMLHQGDEGHVKALKTAKNPLPQKYAQSDKTPEKAKVEARSNTINFDLTD